MQSAARRLPAAVLVTLALAVQAASTAHAQIAWKPCGDSNDFACGHLTVPLDPDGAGGQTLTLAMRRHLAPVGAAKNAVIALAGGPGQAAIPFTEDFDRLLGPILSTRDLIVLDQRGTGLSHSLSCAAFERLSGRAPSPATIGVCGTQLGAEKGFYRTDDTIADIEAIRQAGGYEKLVLYGTSYGTKVAERYAQLHPSHVEALVLDSVVPPNGPDPFTRTSFAAIRRVLRTLCAAGACAHITHEPLADLARLLVRIHAHGPLPAREIGDRGQVVHTAVSAEDLLGILYAGDFDPLLRAEFPAAVRSADMGDTAALARVLHRAETSEGDEPESPVEGFDVPLFYATTCEEESFPWSRDASPAQRLREARAQLRTLPAGAFWPFTAADALGVGGIESCAQWPFSSSQPEVDSSPLPAVPTLILSGEADIRTPTANALQVAGEIPGAHLLVVPHTGHSVLGSALGACPRNALEAFFAARRIQPCRGDEAPPAPRLFPVAPHRLSDVRAARGTRGAAGKALAAVVLALEDFERQSALQFLSQIGAPSLLGLLEVSVGGLRGGWAELAGGKLRLHRYTYVPGVSVTGALSHGAGTLDVTGSSAAQGVLRLTSRGRLEGVLDGTAVRDARRISAP